MRVLMLLHSDKISPPASNPRFLLRFLQHESKGLFIQQEFKGKALNLSIIEGHRRMPFVNYAFIFAAAVLAKIRVN